MADRLEGPYRKFEGNPVLDFSALGGDAQLEDAFVWRDGGGFRMLSRDMGFFGHDAGLYLESADGLRWSEPKISFLPIRRYREEPPAPAHLKKYGRLERPQLLFRGGKPTHLFCAAQGGQYQTATAFVFEIK